MRQGRLVVFLSLLCTCTLCAGQEDIAREHSGIPDTIIIKTDGMTIPVVPVRASAQTIPIRQSSPGTLVNCILLGSILGAAGQGIRILTGLKKLFDEAMRTNTAIEQMVIGKRLLLSVLISCSIGAIAGILAAFESPDFMITKSTIIAFIAAGYAGTDFIEGMFNRYRIPSQAKEHR